MTNSPHRQFTDIVCNGHFPMRTRQQIALLMQRYEGKKLTVEVREYKEKRSCKQNAFYYGVVVPAVHQMFCDYGNAITLDETHDFIKKHVWRHVKHITLPDGEIKEVPDTSTKLTTSAWEDRIEQTRAWAAEFGLEIPFPKEEFPQGHGRSRKNGIILTKGD